MTKWVFKALRAKAEEQRQAWNDRTWNGGVADQLLLTEFRNRADGYVAATETDYEAFCDANGEEPSAE